MGISGQHPKESAFSCIIQATASEKHVYVNPNRDNMAKANGNLPCDNISVKMMRSLSIRGEMSGSFRKEMNWKSKRMIEGCVDKTLGIHAACEVEVGKLACW